MPSLKMLALSVALSALCVLGIAQAPAAPLAFDVVSIRPSTSSPQRGVNIAVHVDGAQVHINSLQLRDFIRMAYSVMPYQITGPASLDGARFDIAATLPSGANRDQVPQMLQTLLATSFGLKFHRDQHDFPVYALVRDGDHFTLQPTAKAADLPAPGKADNAAASGSDRGISLDLGNGSGYSFAHEQFQITKLSMGIFAESLSRYMDRPVVNDTGLADGYTFTLSLTPEDYRIMLIRAAVNSGVVLPPQALAMLEGASPASLYSSLDKIGLKLVSRTAPLPRIVVDHIASAPLAN